MTQKPDRFIRLTLILFLSITFSLLSAQDPPPPPPNGGNPNGGVTPVGGGAPIGDGMLLLIAMGVAYGYHRIKGYKNRKSSTE